jgi:phosphate transport system permease protein
VSQLPAASDSLEATRRLIRRRKRTDRLFGLLGAGLILLSLGVLGVLIVGLFIDGTTRMLATHEVKLDGTAPGFREIVGTLKRARDGWLLELDRMELRVPSTMDLNALKEKRVAVRGTPPRAGETVMQVDGITAIPESEPGDEALGSPDVVGRVISVQSRQRRDEMVLMLQPELMKLTLPTEPELNLAPLEGKRVSVDVGRRGRNAAAGTLRVENVSELVAKSFFASMPSASAYRAGILPALVGTLLVMLVTMCVAVPLGVASGVYLEEYASKNKLTDLLEINIANLAGVPSIIWGLAGLGLFIFGVPLFLSMLDQLVGHFYIGAIVVRCMKAIFRVFGLGRNVLTAGLTLGLLVLPIVIIATREAIRAVPRTIREAAIALGATKWQTTRYHVIPYSLSGILTGSIIALSRAIGETAPLVCIGAVLYITFLPPTPIQSHPPYVSFAWLRSSYTVVPMQIFDWVSRPQPEFHANAAAASVVLVVLTLTLNAIAIAIRYRARKSIKW